MIIKNLGLYISILFIFLGVLIYGDDYSSWERERKNKKIAEDGLQRLADNYGLKIKNPIEDFNQCSYWYAYYEAGINLGFSDVKLKNKDKFMVQCIPVIQELLNKCQAEETELEGKGDSSLVLKRRCRADALDPLIIEK
tara:strand:+ start:75 stop:491 length:417 start_codon:yes stop_codon:yes gene_type:complete